MIDTPMDNDKTEQLTKYLKDSMSVDLAKLIIGHFHDDCMGGLEYLQNIGIESVANSMTIKKCREIGLPVPSTPFTDSLTFDFNGEIIDCRYFGAEKEKISKLYLRFCNFVIKMPWDKKL